MGGLGSRVGRLNGPTPELNVVGLVKIHPFFIRRVNEFGRVWVWLGRVDWVGGWLGYLHNPSYNQGHASSIRATHILNPTHAQTSQGSA